MKNLIRELRFVTPVKSMHLIEKVYYEKWCDNLTITSFFLNDEIMNQIKNNTEDIMIKVA